MNAKEKYVCRKCVWWGTSECWDADAGANDTCDDWTDPEDIEIYDLTEEERYDGGCMSNFDNENPKEVEDYINEGRGGE